MAISGKNSKPAKINSKRNKIAPFILYVLVIIESGKN